MKVFETDRIRNIALVGQRGCGKTSLADAIAFSSGISNRLGKVDDGTSLSDFTEEEINRKSSISMSILVCPWKNLKVNVLDLPGHPDFIGELIVGLNVAETAVIVLNANSGIEVGTEIHYNYVKKFKVPRIFFVNKVEKEHVKTAEVVAQLQERYGLKVVPAQITIGEGPAYKGVVDVVKMKGITFDDKGQPTVGDIPGDLMAAAKAAQQKLMEAVAESDDALLEKFFEQGELSNDEMLSGLKKAIAKQLVYPVLFGSADLNSGVQTLIDFITDYFPAPNIMPPMNLMNTSSDEVETVEMVSTGAPIAYVFKSISEAHIGDISLFKVISGKINQGLDLYNHVKNASERIGQVYSVTGKERSEVEAVNAGDIGAMVKLKNTAGGDTLAPKDKRLAVPAVEFPEPVMDVGIKPKSKGDEEKLSTGLQKLRDEDPTFSIVIDPALKQTVLFTQGSTHTEIVLSKLHKKYSVEVDTFKPRIPYRETIKGKTEIQHRYKKQSGGRGQYGDVHLRIEPVPRGEGFVFADEVKGGVIPGKYIPSVEKGVVEAMEAGGLAGSPVVDVRVAVFYGSYHAVDSSDMAFKIAASMAFKEGFLQCKPVLLEPISKVEILVPEDFTGDVMGDLSSRRGKIAGMDPEGRYTRIRATVPQAELYNYSVDLRSMTSGQGVYSRTFSHYEEVPREIMEKVIADIKQANEE
ncbi:MAG: elongation factor G [candidate division Zixibacteria bacterium HGW-Zixibacteria-1]|nr:MAG: elongation factor G [candidate division Zixibacteria bacterium HGW-Zixibacteria-1]